MPAEDDKVIEFLNSRRRKNPLAPIIAADSAVGAAEAMQTVHTAQSESDKRLVVMITALIEFGYQDGDELFDQIVGIITGSMEHEKDFLGSIKSIGDSIAASVKTNS